MICKPIYYNENMFHINIRNISGRKFALGKSKVHEMVRTLNIITTFLVIV